MIIVQFFLFLMGLFGIVLPFLIEKLPGTHVVLGDGPHWRHPNLYYVDINTGKVARYDSEENRTYQCQIPGEKRVSYIIPYRGTTNMFSVGVGNKGAKMQWDGMSQDCNVVEILFKVEAEDPNYKNNCLNDAKCDAKGRLYTGTVNCDVDLSRAHQHLYRYAEGQVEPVHGLVNISNGMTFDEERKALYYADSGANTITKFNYNMKTGRATNPQVVFTLNTNEFPPNDEGMIILDGMTIDSEGYVYETIFGGGTVVKIDTRTWNIVERYKMPCAYVSSAVFGGPNLDELYVTSAKSFGNSTFFPPPCGSTFRVRGLSARGVKTHEME